jgi:hypothetical protein
MWALPGLSDLPVVRADEVPIDNFLAFEKTVVNIVVIMMVALVVAGPLFGIFALQIRELNEVVKKDDASFRYVANTVVVLVGIIPALMFTFLLLPANQALLLVEHPDQVDLGLLIGLLAVVAAGVALIVADWRRRKRLSRDRHFDFDDYDDDGDDNDEESDPEEKSANTDEIERAKGKRELTDLTPST